NSIQQCGPLKYVPPKQFIEDNFELCVVKDLKPNIIKKKNLDVSFGC
ncbi:5850_t:CDS:1, partial [Rhizophagus irregularis]